MINGVLGGVILPAQVEIPRAPLAIDICDQVGCRDVALPDVVTIEVIVNGGVRVFGPQRACRRCAESLQVDESVNVLVLRFATE